MQSDATSIRRTARTSWLIALLIIFLAALAVRLYGLDWDDGTDLHPDELFVARIVLIDRIHFAWPVDWNELRDPARSGLNPRSADPLTGQFREFAYGALPLWITDFVAWVLSRITGTNWNAAERAYLVGRSLSALLGALTIVPVAWLGRAVGGWRVGILAALFAALAPMSIQLAHFFTTDSWLAFFVALCLAACVAAAVTGKRSRFLLAGVLVGLAIATKGSVFTLGVPVAAALAIDFGRRSQATDSMTAVGATAARSALATLGAIAAFLLFEPFALIRPDVYLQSLRTQADIASGAFDVPFTRVYVGTTPVLYQIEQLLRWGYGPVAGLLALLGGLTLVVMASRRRSSAAAVLVSWTIAYAAVLAVSEVKFLRYLEPLAPVLAVAAAVGVTQAERVVRDLRWGVVQRVALPALLTLSALWSAAFLSIYAHEHPRLAASRWIYAEMPPGSVLSAEYWDDALPRALGPGYAGGMFGYATVMLDPYHDLPPEGASDAVFAGMRRADYIVQSSQRVASAIAATLWRYPVQNRFFDLLRRGELGFRQMATFSRAPSLPGFTFDDRAADESFLNYDHPNVAIYQRTERLPRAEYDLAMSWALRRPWSPTREPPRPSLLLDQPVGENPAVNDARWSASFTAATPAALAIWIVLLLALLAAGRPLAWLLFRGFPDQGWGLARTIALAAAAYPVWLGASLELISFRAVWALVSLATVAIVGWRLARRIQPATSEGSASVRLQAEAAFWLVFLLFLAFRLITPDGWHPIWGGEKAMEFAQINAIGRSAYFPPYDPWYADGYVNYYYYGFYLVAFLFKLTGIPSEIGFNLALPTMMALLAGGGFSIASALAWGMTRSRRLAVAGGWLGAAALSVLGNLSAVRGLAEGGLARVDPFIHWTWNGSRAIKHAITEFPFFSGLYADLHAHVIALPLTVALIALAYALVLNARGDGAGISRPDPLVLGGNLLLIALTLGSLSATNAWDVPVYALLAVAAIFMATAAVAPWPRRMALFAGASLLTTVGSWLLFLPFHRHFVALFGQVALVRDPTAPIDFFSHVGGWVLVCAFGMATLYAAGRSGPATPRTPWLAVAAVLLALAVLWTRSEPHLVVGAAALLYAGLTAPPLTSAWYRSGGPGAGGWPRWLVGAVVVGSVAVSIVAIAAGRFVFAVAFTLGAVAALGWLLSKPVASRFVCLLLTAGFFTMAGVELIVVADDLLGSSAYRMNTVFKFYNQIWVLLALAAAPLTMVIVREAVLSRRQSWRGGNARASAGWVSAGATAATAVIALSLLYPLLATGPRLAQRFSPGTPTGSLDALAWMKEGTVPSFGDGEATAIRYSGDLAAIAWLWWNVTGSEVVAEASIGPYRCNGSRISAATGLPTIIGWERHQQQQRYPETLPARVEDVRRLYTSPDPDEKERILRRYNVAYVVVGDLERRYPLNSNECSPTGAPEGIAAFDSMVGDTLEVAFTAEGTTVYRVLPLRAG